MKKILITGGAGFLGSHLVNKLKNDYKIVIVDTLKGVGGIPYVPTDIIHLNYDITDKKLYQELNNHNFFAIYHLAAQSAGEPAYDNPQYDIMNNSYGTCLMAKYCMEKEIKRFIYTSTVAVYGTSKNKNIFDENSPILPDSIYGVSKYSGELFVKQFLSASKSNFTIFRVFNTYGPGENLNYLKKGMVSIYASYIWRNLPIIVKGSVNRYRNFLYVDDNINALTKSLNHGSAFNQIYNLSGGDKVLVKDLLKIMIKKAGKNSDYPIIEEKNTPGDSFGTHGRIDKIRSDLNWDPKVTLDKGLESYFEWINRIPVSDDISNYHIYNMEE
ncbi:MAG: hypothetical protein CMG74_10435 [Candidatus Marinimicrobia bacterium]|nr:hypothetical protein [Candidatus Neomarinimicrobiota bacterium]|tara:strand:- start:11628 stop:12611 length:984 start_codon:yes stop_codon:yes gene_type:complete